MGGTSCLTAPLGAGGGCQVQRCSLSFSLPFLTKAGDEVLATAYGTACDDALAAAAARASVRIAY